MLPLDKRRVEAGLNEEAFKSEYNHLLETLAGNGGGGGGGNGGGMTSRNVSSHRGGGHHSNHPASNGIGSKGLFRDISGISGSHPIDSRGTCSQFTTRLF